MYHAWNVKYIEFTDFGNGYAKKEIENIFITYTRDLNEIEKAKRVVHPINRLYSFIEIVNAEYLGKCELSFENMNFLKIEAIKTESEKK